ncbi:MAG: hypothetical protein WBV46_19120, partial [Terriglobales bacterium]
QTTQLHLEPYNGFPNANGYMHLEQVQRGETSGNIMSRFENEGTTLSLEVLGGASAEVYQGVAPGPHPAIKVPFVIVRRKAIDAQFISLLVPSRGTSPTITVSAAQNVTITVHGPNWVDSVTLGDVISYHRAVVTAESKSP